MKVVIDTNCLLASIPPKNPEYWLSLSFRRKDFDWVISNEILLEYEEIITDFYSPKTADWSRTSCSQFQMSFKQNLLFGGN